MKKLHCIISPEQKICSPGVGYFKPSLTLLPDGEVCIGILVRLETPSMLCVPGARPVRPSGENRWVMVGDVIAEFESESTVIHDKHDPVDTKNHQTIQSPTDGFVYFHDETGQPYIASGARLSPGDVIAVIEWMKIRMDIEFSGPEGAVFETYCGRDGRPVRRGDAIAEWYLQH